MKSQQIVPWSLQSWLPDGYSQILRSHVFGPLGFLTVAPLRYKIRSLLFLGLRPPALHPGKIQGKEGIKFCHLATLAPPQFDRSESLVRSSLRARSVRWVRRPEREERHLQQVGSEGAYNILCPLHALGWILQHRHPHCTCRSVGKDSGHMSAKPLSSVLSAYFSDGLVSIPLAE